MRAVCFLSMIDCYDAHALISEAESSNNFYHAKLIWFIRKSLTEKVSKCTNKPFFISKEAIYVQKQNEE